MALSTQDRKPAARSRGARRAEVTRQQATATLAQAGRPRRLRPGLHVGALPVTALVAIELVALVVLIVPDVHAVWRIVLGAAAVVLALLTLVPVRGTTLLVWLGTFAAYRLRPRGTTVSAPAHQEHVDMDSVDVPPEVDAFFPGMRLRDGVAHDGQRFGLTLWRQCWSATIRVRETSGLVSGALTAPRLPLGAIVTALHRRELPVDALQVITQTVGGRPEDYGSATLTAAAAELFGRDSQVRNRETLITVRVDPGTAEADIEARGGGTAGVDRLLSAIIGCIRAELFRVDLRSDLLDSAALGRAIATGMFQPATADGRTVSWREGWSVVSSSQTAHRSFVLAGLRRPELDALTAVPTFALTVGTQIRPIGDGRATSVTVVRVTARTAAGLDRAAGQLRTVARRSGMLLRDMRGEQYLGVRATLPIGGV